MPTKDANGDITGSQDLGGFAQGIYTDRSGLGDGAAVQTQLDTIVKIRTAPEGFQGASAVILNNVDDELDPVALELSIQDLCQTIEERKGLVNGPT